MSVHLQPRTDVFKSGPFVPTEEKYIWKWPWSVDTYITEYVYMKVALICYSVQLHLNPVEILYLPQNVALEYWLKYLLC